MTVDTLDARQVDLVGAFVGAWKRSDHVPFDFHPAESFSHPCWLPDVRDPDREEVRRLRHLGMLDVDEAAAPIWRVYPSPAARLQFGGDEEHETVAALSDPDQRLGVILQATVEAFEANPAEPLRLWPMAAIDLVRHSNWPLQPDVARVHDLQQLEDLGLMSLSSQERGYAFWPTLDGRAAVHNAADLLERRAAKSGSENEATRLRRWAERLRSGDLAVGVVAGTATAVIRALIGF